MNASDQAGTEHRESWELLPWLVNGRLEDGEARRVEAHLRLCQPCREEYAAQRRIHEIIAADATVERMPSAGLNKLRQRIGEAHAGAGDAAPALPPPQREARPTPRWPWRNRLLAASVGAVALAVGLDASTIWHAWRRPEAAAYYTVSSTPSPHPEAVVRAVFAPNLTVAELQALLDDAHLRIVAGPTEAGVYSLAADASPSTDWSLRRLRAHDTVRFAEAIGAAAAAPP